MHEKTAELLEKCLFTSTKPEEKTHRCVIVFNHRHAITYQHGGHESLKTGEEIVIYNVLDREMSTKVVVFHVEPKSDVIILRKEDGDFPQFPQVDTMYCGRKYFQLGVNSKREPQWKNGVVSSRHAGFYLGTSYGEHGDSGSGVFTEAGRIMGVSVQKKRFEFSSVQIRGSSIDFGSLADHHSETKMISADYIFAFLDPASDDNDDTYEPPRKKADVE